MTVPTHGGPPYGSPPSQGPPYGGPPYGGPPYGGPPPPDRGLLGRRRTRMLAIAVLALGGLGLVGFGIGALAQAMPRKFTAAQRQQITDWEYGKRWRDLTAGAIFSASVSYPAPTALDDDPGLTLSANRVGVAKQAACAAVTDPAAAAVLGRDGCAAILRATYVDATDSYVVTVGAAVLPGTAQAAAAARAIDDVAAASTAVHAVPVAGTPGRRVHRQAAAAVRPRVGRPVRRPLYRRLRRQPAQGARHGRRLHGSGDEERGSGGRPRRAVGARRAGAAAQLPGDAWMLRTPRMLGRALAGGGLAATLGLLPALPAAAAVNAPGDAVRDSQQWVFNMMNVAPAWQVTEGSGVTVAVIDSGVYPNVSDLSGGTVISGPDFTGLNTSPQNANWGQHGTWMASIIAGHGTTAVTTGSWGSRRRRRSFPFG